MINTHAAAAIAGAILAGAFTWKVQGWRYDHQITSLQAKHQAEVQAANDRALAAERLTNQRIAEARNAAAKREQDLRRDGDALRDASDRLREQAAAARRDLPTATADAARHTAAAATAILESCVREYQALARAADGHANDALTLEQSWPR